MHKARVATRRLRSDLRLLEGELDPVWTRFTRGELKWLGEVLGVVRDIDVLTTTVLEATGRSPSSVELEVTLVDEHRDGPTPFTNRGGNLLYLVLRMRSGIACVGNQLPDRPAFYLVRMPLVPILARAHNARARQWGS